MKRKRDELVSTGRCWHRAALNKDCVDRLKKITNVGGKPGNRIGNRALSSVIAKIEPLLTFADGLLPSCRPVRATVFNKEGEANWAVGWHQDRVISVKQKHEQDGFKHWTRKSGVWHCEPPSQYLSRMMFVRIHLDTATAENGCLEIARKSHLLGNVRTAQIAGKIKGLEKEICIAKPGDVLFCNALLIHRSKPSTDGDPRGAIRIDFADFNLPVPLEWAYP